MTPESKIAAGIRRLIAADGGLVRKCSWEARAGAPDLLVLYRGRHAWVECKAPGERPRVSQVREFDRMREAGGCTVCWFDSVADFSAWWEAWKQGAVYE